jgi:NAD(P)H-hydrate epimerase
VARISTAEYNASNAMTRWLLTKKQMQAMDRIAIDEIGVGGQVLMEVAGRAVADRTQDLYRACGAPGVLALAGSGNNGGDAVVAARHLHDRGVPTSLVVAGEKFSADLAHQLRMVEKLGGPRPLIIGGPGQSEEDAARALEPMLVDGRVVIDGLFGTGLARPITGLYRRLIEVLDAHANPVVAVDIPSGIDADNGQILGVAVRARATVTFQHAKLGHVIFPGRAHTGELVVADIGIPRALIDRVQPSATIVEDQEVDRALPSRAQDGHKGTYGHLLVVAGVPDRPGSSLLASRAALRTGAGLVTLASTVETIRRLAPELVELMGHSAGADRLDAEAVLEALSGKTALAIGPSLPPDAQTRALLEAVLPKADVPVVIDAGALTAIGADVAFLQARKKPTILTPHPGEMARLLGTDTKTVQQDRPEAARMLAHRSRAHVVLKGASTVVASPSGSVGVVLAGNAGMATGGTGDVLTGIIGALLAQGVEGERAARAGAQLHAMAGDLACAERGAERLVASDLIAAVGRLPRRGTAGR